MRTIPVLILVTALVAVAGCAARQTPASLYTCGEHTAAPLHASGGVPVLMVGSTRAERTRRDGAGDHFVVVQGESVLDYVLPDDASEDALVWDTSGGARELRERCTAKGGHTDILTRWLGGESLSAIGSSIGVRDEDEVRTRLSKAIRWMMRRSRDEGALPARLAPNLASR